MWMTKYFWIWKKRKRYHSVQPWDQTFIYLVEEFIIIFNFKLYLQLSKKRDKELGLRLPSKVAKIKGSCENGRKSQKSGFRQSIDQILREQKYLLCRDLPSTLLKFTFSEERGTESWGFAKVLKGFDLHVKSFIEILFQSVVRNIRDVGHLGRDSCCSHVLDHLAKRDIHQVLKIGIFWNLVCRAVWVLT